MKEFQEPTLELVTFEGDIITASECPDKCRDVCDSECLVNQWCTGNCKVVG